MHGQSILVLAILCMALRPLQAEVVLLKNEKLVFEGSNELSEHSWDLKDLDPKVPFDWSSFHFLVIELKASSAQRFQVRLYTPEGVSPLYLQPFQNAWIRVVLPLEMFQSPPQQGSTLSDVFNRQHAGYFMFHWGPYLPLAHVERVSFAMPQPIGKPTLEIRSARLASQSPGEALLEQERLVDPWGQWIRDQWPGKVQTLEELRKSWTSEKIELKQDDFGYCRYGGFSHTKAQATGFFRVEQVDGIWWFVDPDGHHFFSAGVDVVSPFIITPTQGRTSIFSVLPPPEMLRGQPESQRPGASFYLANIQRRWGREWQKSWVNLTVDRMYSWGLNTVANWSTPEILGSKRIPYVVNLEGWRTRRSYFGLPDVYSKEFGENSEAAASRQCKARRTDAFLLGYFIGNEPPWPGRELVIVQMILDGPRTATQHVLKKVLSEGDTTDRRKAFVYQAYRKYLEVIIGAVRRHDPNHLILGIRFGGHAPDEMVSASKGFDVFSLNIYDYVPDKALLERIHQLSGRPLLIGEFHFGVPGRGMSAGLRQVRDQQERGVAYRHYVENAAAMPALIGTHWFQWADEPNTGRFDGENYNIGLVDVTDRPYAEMVEAMQATHRRLHAIHSRKQSPVVRKPLLQ